MHDDHDDDTTRKEIAAGAIAPLVEDNPHIPLVTWIFLSRLQFLLALGVGVFCFYRTMLWIDNNLRGEWSFAGVGVLLAIMLMSVICGMVFHFATRIVLRQLPRWKTLMAINGVVLWVIGAGLLAPMQQTMTIKTQEKQQALHRLRHEARPVELPPDGGLALKHQQWQERLHRTGAHAAPGIVPPMLTVKDEGDTVWIRHNHSSELYVALARVRQSGDAWEGCRMKPVGKRGRSRPFLEGRGGRHRFSYRVEPGTLTEYKLYPDCAADYVDAPVEYRVGVYGSSTGWWSDSALAEPLPSYQLEIGKAH